MNARSALVAFTALLISTEAGAVTYVFDATIGEFINGESGFKKISAYPANDLGITEGVKLQVSATFADGQPPSYTHDLLSANFSLPNFSGTPLDPPPSFAITTIDGSYIPVTGFFPASGDPRGLFLGFYFMFGNGFADRIGGELPLTREFLIASRNTGSLSSFRIETGNIEYSGRLFLNDVQIVGGPIVARVPEPATWAFLFAGFGVIGGGMRRRIKCRLVLHKPS